MLGWDIPQLKSLVGKKEDDDNPDQALAVLTRSHKESDERPESNVSQPQIMGCPEVQPPTTEAECNPMEEIGDDDSVFNLDDLFFPRPVPQKPTLTRSQKRTNNRKYARGQLPNALDVTAAKLGRLQEEDKTGYNKLRMVNRVPSLAVDSTAEVV